MLIILAYNFQSNHINFWLMLLVQHHLDLVI